VRVLGINSNVKHSVGGGAYGRTRCAAFMAHAIILQAMHEAGHEFFISENGVWLTDHVPSSFIDFNERPKTSL